MVLENRVLTKCFGISKHHTQRQADDLSRTDGDGSGKVWGTLDSDYNEGESALLKGLLTARKDGQDGGLIGQQGNRNSNSYQGKSVRIGAILRVIVDLM